MEPFRQLLSAKTFFWDELFETSKDKIIELVKDDVRTFEPQRPTCLTTDWSITGIGFDLTQKHCDCQDPSKPDCGDDHWKLVFAGSRFTNDAENRYAPIERGGPSSCPRSTTLSNVRNGIPKFHRSSRP